MAASLIIEAESGTYRGRTPHPHNGYYAGDFSNAPFRPLNAALVLAGEAHRTPS
jgi:hypothetical protein